MSTLQPCDCMVVEQSDGSSRCRRCRADWYGCDCPAHHSVRCQSLKVWCPTCESLGYVEGPDAGWYEIECPVCDGTGSVPASPDLQRNADLVSGGGPTGKFGKGSAGTPEATK